MSNRVEMRASHIRANLLTIEQLGAAAAEVRGRIPKAVLAEVNASSSVGWLPVECDLAITRAVIDVVGQTGNRKWSRDALLKSASGPLLKPLLDGARAVFGVTPHGVYKVVPRGFSLIYRNAGELHYEERGVTAATLSHTGVPTIFQQESWYLEGIAGALEAGYAVFGLRGAVTVSAGGDEASYRASWDP